MPGGKPSSFETASPRILKAVRTGSSLTEAARLVGVPIGTVRSWGNRGREYPDRAFGKYARELEAIREDRTSFGLGEEEEADLADRPMSHGEIERRLTAAIRRDNLAAMRLWLDIHPREDEPPNDELSWLEQGT